MILKVSLFSISIIYFIIALPQSQCFDAKEAEFEWNQYKKTHDKHYTPDEESRRKQKFFERKKLIEDHNDRYKNGDVGFKLKINWRTDMYEHEMTTMNMKNNRSLKHFTIGSVPRFDITNDPENFDWRERNRVTPVKNQKQCGACWAFSTVGTLESHFYIQNNVSILLSEQNLVDCSGTDTKYQNLGCKGGFLPQAFEYVKDNGVSTQALYPYKEAEKQCKQIQTNCRVNIKAWETISWEESLQHIVANFGPVSVAIDASDPMFQFYHEGIYDNPNCTSDYLTHGLVVVGYGVTKQGNEKYWILKNSWGNDWGENGYMRLKRNGNNLCGIVSNAIYPIGVGKKMGFDESCLKISSQAAGPRHLGITMILSFSIALIFKLL